MVMMMFVVVIMVVVMMFMLIIVIVVMMLMFIVVIMVVMMLMFIVVIVMVMVFMLIVVIMVMMMFMLVQRFFLFAMNFDHHMCTSNTAFHGTLGRYIHTRNQRVHFFKKSLLLFITQQFQKGSCQHIARCTHTALQV